MMKYYIASFLVLSFFATGHCFLFNDMPCEKYHGHCQSPHEGCSGHLTANRCSNSHSHHAVCCIPSHTTCMSTRKHPVTQPSVNSSYSCGISHVGSVMTSLFRVMGGHASYPGQWPWQVIITENGEFACAGVVINNRWILTAAHCCDTKVSKWMHMESKYQVITGENDMSVDEGREVTYNISKIVPHPHFGGITAANDIALVELSNAITFGTYVSPVCLPEPSDSYEGQHCLVLGWGETKGTGNPTILQWVKIPVIDNAECQKKYSAHSRDKILHTNICAGEAGKDSCKGDSGGPLLCRKNNRWVVVGLVSWGDACGDGDHPGVYTRVQCYTDWISTTINS